MNILAFDTSTNACVVALQHGSEVKFLQNSEHKQQAKLVLPMIHSLLEQFSLSLQQLDVIAYGCGPGSFTGIRIANSVAQGLAFASQKLLTPVSSMAMLAQSAYQELQAQNCLVMLDARMEQVYWAVYRAKLECVELIGQEEICRPDAINVTSAGEWCAVGDGWNKYEDSIVKKLGFAPKLITANQQINPIAMLKLARSNFERWQSVSALNASPSYLR